MKKTSQLPTFGFLFERLIISINTTRTPKPAAINSPVIPLEKVLAVRRQTHDLFIIAYTKTALRTHQSQITNRLFRVIGRLITQHYISISSLIQISLYRFVTFVLQYLFT